MNFLDLIDIISKVTDNQDGRQITGRGLPGSGDMGDALKQLLPHSVTPVPEIHGRLRRKTLPA